MLKSFAIRPAGVAGVPAGVQRLDYESGADGRRDWALAWAPPGASRRWLVMVHGHGSHGDQLYVRADIREAWLGRFRELGFGLLTPNLRDNAWMSPAAVADLHALLARVRDEWRAESFVFFSGSMGGTSNLIYAACHPEDVAAAVALGAATDIGAYRQWCRGRRPPVVEAIGDAIEAAYGGPPERVPAPYAAHRVLGGGVRLSMPVLLAHGELDALMPVEQARALADEMSGAAGFRYIEVAGGQHDAPLFLDEALAWLAARQA